MKAEHHVYCGGVKSPETKQGNDVHRLNLWPKAGSRNITLNIHDLSDKFLKHVPEQFHDLIEIAAYVYSGDQMFSRGKIDVDNFGGKWRRHLHYTIPVRNPDFWNSTDVINTLRSTLEFLGDDLYEFTFSAAKDAPDLQNYLVTGVGDGGSAPEEVSLFSGGLDSLAGAIEEAVTNRTRVALVNHRSTGKFGDMQDELSRLLAEKAGRMSPMLVRVKINKDECLGKDQHQRVRSFLYASLGGTVAKMLGLNRLRFYENGVLSLNLPICGQVVGARATRTTHPRVLDGLGKLLSHVAGEKFVVENPFLLKTKGDVVKQIVDAGCGELIRYSRSCAHTWDRSNAKPQCGTCSQCLDRRIAVLAVDAEQFDPLESYETDMFLKERRKDGDKILGVAFINRAQEIAGMRDAVEFAKKYAEITKVLPYCGGKVAARLEQFFKLYQSHAAEVKKALEKLIKQNVIAIMDRTLPAESLVRCVYEAGSVTSTPMAPAANGKPENEVSVKGKVTESNNGGFSTIGRLKYSDDFLDVWVGDEHFNLRNRPKAKLCLQYLIECKAFDPTSARHLVDEIDVYVRKAGNYEKSAEIKIDHYFGDRRGVLPDLRKKLIHAAGRNGRFFLKTD